MHCHHVFASCGFTQRERERGMFTLSERERARFHFNDSTLRTLMKVNALREGLLSSFLKGSGSTRKANLKQSQTAPRPCRLSRGSIQKNMLKHKSSGADESKQDAGGCQQTSKDVKEGTKVASQKCKSTFKHSKTSTAYRPARAAALKAGDSPNTCKIKAKQASRKIAALIYGGVLKEE